MADLSESVWVSVKVKASSDLKEFEIGFRLSQLEGDQVNSV